MYENNLYYLMINNLNALLSTTWHFNQSFEEFDIAHASESFESESKSAFSLSVSERGARSAENTWVY